MNETCEPMKRVLSDLIKNNKFHFMIHEKLSQKGPTKNRECNYNPHNVMYSCHRPLFYRVFIKILSQFLPFSILVFYIFIAQSDKLTMAHH